MKKEEIAFYIILLLGAVLRFYSYDDWSLTNDELSALMRTKFDSFSMLLNEGVKLDGHPAATHVFEYYWTSLFGDSVGSLRFPFVVFGTLSIYYAYRTASEWIGSFAALFVAASIAVSEFFVLYSQIARPYSMGCFLVLIFSYYWTLYLKGNSKIKISIGFIVTAALAILTHYFATLSIFLLLLTGFIIISKNQVRKYFYHLLLIAVICAPHLPITLFQLSVGGVGGWLPTPEVNFILEFFDFITNNYWLHQLFYIVIPITSIIWSSSKLNFKWSLIGLMIFIVTYLIGYFYSTKVNAVLQFSVLIFSTPFLIAFIFFTASFKLRKNMGFLFLGLFISSGLYALLIKNDFYDEKKFANYKGIAENLKFYEDSIGTENTITILNSSSHKYFEYYFKDLDNFNPTVEVNSINGIEDIAKVKNILDTTSKEYIIVAWANKFLPYEIHEIVKSKFPSRTVHLHYFNSEFSIYKKAPKKRNTVFFQNNTLENNIENWEIDRSKIDSSNFFSPPYSFKVDESTEYAMTYRSKVSEIFIDNVNFLTITSKLRMHNPTNAKIVVSVTRKGEQIDWRGFELNPFYMDDKWFTPIYVYEKNYNLKYDDEIAIYIWNPSFQKFWVDDFTLTVFKDSDYNYYSL